jgi:hypothetical protein
MTAHFSAYSLPVDADADAMKIASTLPRRRTAAQRNVPGSAIALAARCAR